MKRPIALLILLTAAAHAGVEVDIDQFGESLGGWTKEGKKAAEYKFSETDYRTYKPEVTTAPDGGVFISVRVDHLRGLFSADDHASIEMSFGPDGTLLSSQAAISIQERRISSDLFRSGGQSAAKAAGDLVGGTAEKAAKLGSNVFASLASKVLRENVTEPGRIAYPAALRHNYNLLYQCVKVTKDPPKALPVEGETAAAKKTEEPEKKSAPEGMLEVRTFGEAPKEEPKDSKEAKKEPEAAKP
ncbi:MAG: hypothetical protein IAE77_12535 [Prosthecobacter sp.]|uniref:hypothetical protein n=1 Tax=Prosthecobacter sp. TaxID=1965333 RepID=UPI001A0BC6EC|nr:hypothetical protein [Prosthecobacter sp.]MBE2284275.1 hypothetical protein [Prosthecobacter sp.]